MEAEAASQEVGGQLNVIVQEVVAEAEETMSRKRPAEESSPDCTAEKKPSPKKPKVRQEHWETMYLRLKAFKEENGVSQ